MRSQSRFKTNNYRPQSSLAGQYNLHFYRICPIERHATGVIIAMESPHNIILHFVNRAADLHKKEGLQSLILNPYQLLAFCNR